MSSSDEKHAINRRDLLKVLGAAGAGLVGSLLLPGKWDKPVTRMGVLPAHAQASVVTYDIIRSAESIVFIPQNESDQATLTVYIDPPDSGIAMRATYEIEEEVPSLSQPAAYGPPVALPDVSTTSGAATFAPFDLGFWWLNLRVTYEFVNADACGTTCERVVTVARPTPQ
jgi:hypothetical protein